MSNTNLTGTAIQHLSNLKYLEAKNILLTDHHIKNLTELIFIEFGGDWRPTVCEITHNGMKNLKKIQSIICEPIKHWSPDLFISISHLKSLEIISYSYSSTLELKIHPFTKLTVDQLLLHNFSLVKFPFQNIQCQKHLLLFHCKLCDDYFKHFPDITYLTILSCKSVSPLLYHYLPKLKDMILDSDIYVIFTTEICKKIYQNQHINVRSIC